MNFASDGVDEMNENCWATGIYNDLCDCAVCMHKYECSGAVFYEEGEDYDE